MSLEDAGTGRQADLRTAPAVTLVPGMAVEAVISPSGVLRLILWCIVALIPPGLVCARLKAEGMFGRWPEIFLFDAERNVPTLFSFVLMLVIFAQLLIIARREWVSGGAWRRHWAGLALLFFIMPFDEASSLHEHLIRPLRKLLDTGGAFYHAWVIPGLMFVAFMTFVYFRFVLALPRPLRERVILAGALYIGGAIGFEMIGGAWYDAHSGGMAYQLIGMVEETLEMLGLSVFLWALLDHLTRRPVTVAFRA